MLQEFLNSVWGVYFRNKVFKALTFEWAKNKQEKDEKIRSRNLASEAKDCDYWKSNRPILEANDLRKEKVLNCSGWNWFFEREIITLKEGVF